MRIATYNLWNSPRSWPQRLGAACEEIQRVDADVVALQEVRARVDDSDHRNVATYIAHEAGYRYVVFEAYSHDPSEGLAFLSWYPFVRSEAGWHNDSQPAEGALRIQVRAGDTPLSITNVHLDSSMVGLLQKERQMTAIAVWIAARQEPGMLDLLCGDFNAYPGSSIHNFLLGQASLHGHSAQWFDLALYDAHHTGVNASPTLDFMRNPRWSQEHTIAIPARFDWILLRDCYPDPYPYVDRVELFGTEPTPIAQVVPSDHYGVFADIRLPRGTTALNPD